MLIKKTPISIIAFYLLSILLIAHQYPTKRSLFGIAFLSFVILCFVLHKKYRGSCVQDKFSQGTLLRNVAIEIVGVLFALTLATLLSWHSAEFITHYVNHDPTKFMVGITIGLIAGVITGVLIKRITDYLIKLSYNNYALNSTEKESSWTN